MSRGQVTAIDVHQPYLDRLSKRIEQADLSDRVEVLSCSMLEIAFPDESFDVVWAEGSIYIEEALRVFDSEEREIDMFRRYHEWYGAVFFIMKKSGGG